MKKMVKVFTCCALIVALSVQANAAHYGFNIGAIQGSIGNAVEQEIKKNPNWYQEFIERLMEQWNRR